MRPYPQRAVAVFQERTDQPRGDTIVVGVLARLPVDERQQAAARESNPYAVAAVRIRGDGRPARHRRQSAVVGERAVVKAIQTSGIAQPQPAVRVAGHGGDPEQRHAVREGNLRQSAIFDTGKSRGRRRPYGAALVQVQGVDGVPGKASGAAIESGFPIGQLVQSARRSRPYGAVLSCPEAHDHLTRQLRAHQEPVRIVHGQIVESTVGADPDVARLVFVQRKYPLAREAVLRREPLDGGIASPEPIRDARDPLARCAPPEMSPAVAQNGHHHTRGQRGHGRRLRQARFPESRQLAADPDGAGGVARHGPDHPAGRFDALEGIGGGHAAKETGNGSQPEIAGGILVDVEQHHPVADALRAADAFPAAVAKAGHAVWTARPDRSLPILEQRPDRTAGQAVARFIGVNRPAADPADAAGVPESDPQGAVRRSVQGLHVPLRQFRPVQCLPRNEARAIEADEPPAHAQPDIALPILGDGPHRRRLQVGYCGPRLVG